MLSVLSEQGFSLVTVFGVDRDYLRRYLEAVAVEKHDGVERVEKGGGRGRGRATIIARYVCLHARLLSESNVTSASRTTRLFLSGTPMPLALGNCPSDRPSGIQIPGTPAFL